MARVDEQMVEQSVQPLCMQSWFISITLAACLTGLSTNAPACASGKGTLSTYTCGADSTTKSSFVNLSGQSFIRAAAGKLSSPSSSAGGDWEGLSNTPFQSLSFDVQGAPSATENGDFKFFVVLHGTGGGSDLKSETVEFFGGHEFSSALDLGNGFTRYTIKQGARSFANQLPTPTSVNRIVFNQYPVSDSNHAIVFGNILLNGAIKPVEKMMPSYCPAITGDAVN